MNSGGVENIISNNNHRIQGGAGGGTPCGACKFLRRKCVSGCVFAPYFGPEQGTTHFAAVHKVFGASNASKMLLQVPANKRVDAVVTLCYEALARARDPVYGCVGHLFTLQQQVVALQAELASAQARLSTLHRIPTPPPPPAASLHQFHHQQIDQQFPLSSSEQTSIDIGSFCGSVNGHDLDDDLQALTDGFVYRYYPAGAVKFMPPTSSASP